MSNAPLGHSPSRHDHFLKSFQEATPGELDGKEGYLVEYVAGEKVQLLTAAGNEIGVCRGKLAPGDTAVNVALLNKPGTDRFVQSAAIAEGAKVMSAIGGKIVTATSGHRSIGRKISPGNGAAGDFIQVLIFVENI